VGLRAHRLKRLEYVAQNLGQMFCGWRLISSKPRLVQLGSGSLEINALTGGCSFDGRQIETLPIAQELQLWLVKELAEYDINPKLLTSACLKVNLSFSLVPWGEGTARAEQFFADGKEIRTTNRHRCEISCESEVVTESSVYRSTQSDIEEWPTEWPNSGQICRESESV